MKPIPIFHGRVHGGRLRLDKRDAFAELIRSLEGQEIEITLRRRRDPRTLNQNAYFHGVVLPVFADYAGYVVDDLKSELKRRFLTKNGAARNTSDLNSEEMAEFLERVIALAERMGCIIPPPGHAR